MKCAVLNELEKVTLEDIKVEPLLDGDIRIKIELCGVCGSDIKSYLRGTPYSPPPTVLGHEVVGTVKESKNKRWKKGDRVAVAHYISCGHCEYCLAGQNTLCPELFHRKISPGGFAEFLRVPKELADRGTFKISNDIDFKQVVLAEPLACCIHGAKIANIQIGSNVLVIGDGPMGLLHLQVAKMFGAGKVLISGMNSHRLKIAGNFADKTIDARKDNVNEMVKNFTNGIGPEIIIVAVASTAAVKQAINMIRPGGTVLLFGGFKDGTQLDIDPNQVHYDEVKLVGSVGSLIEDFSTALKILESGKIISYPLLTNLYSLDNVSLALERGARQEGVKSVIDPWAHYGTDKLLLGEDQ